MSNPRPGLTVMIQNIQNLSPVVKSVVVQWLSLPFQLTWIQCWCDVVLPADLNAEAEILTVNEIMADKGTYPDSRYSSAEAFTVCFPSSLSCRLMMCVVWKLTWSVERLLPEYSCAGDIFQFQHITYYSMCRTFPTMSMRFLVWFTFCLDSGTRWTLMQDAQFPLSFYFPFFLPFPFQTLPLLSTSLSFLSAHYLSAAHSAAVGGSEEGCSCAFSECSTWMMYDLQALPFSNCSLIGPLNSMMK